MSAISVLPTPPRATPSGVETPHSAEIPRGGQEQYRQGVQNVKTRIDAMFDKDSEFAKILHSKLDLTGQTTQRVAGLGGGVGVDKMEKMLESLEGLKQKGLSVEHIQAIFLAGFVKGGVEGVLQFIGDGKAEHLQAGENGSAKMQQLLETDYKRSVLFVRKQGFFSNLEPVFRSIFKRQGVLDEWQKQIDEEDARAADSRESFDETWNSRTQQSGWFNIDDTGIDRRALQRLNDTTFMGPRRCHDRSWYIAEAITGVRSAPSSSAQSRTHQGRPMTDLATMDLKPGDVIYVSKNPGSDPQSMNLNNLPHWGVVIGRTPEGEPILSDNNRRKVLLSGWVQYYGSTRLIDEVFRNSRQTA